MNRLYPLLLALACVLIVAAPGLGAGSARIGGLDVGNLPRVDAVVVTSAPSTRAPVLVENGERVFGVEAENLGRAKSLVLAIDRSQSMEGTAFNDAVGGARSFVAAKVRADRVSLVGFGSRALQLTKFSSATIDSDGALRTLSIDPKQGTALWEAVALSAAALGSEPYSGRVLVVLTDGANTAKTASLDDAIEAARDAGVVVYGIGIESNDFSPGPLQQLALKTGGRYYGAASTAALRSIYASIAREFKRTWRVSYYTSARGGDELKLSATVPGFGSAVATTTVPGDSAQDASAGPSRLLPSFVYEHGLGAALLTLIVGFCVLAGVSLVLTTPRGARLRRRLEPHLAPPARREKTSTRDKLAAAEGVLSATERAFGHLKLWAKLERLIDRSDVPLRVVEVFYIAAGGGLLLSLVAAVSAQPTLVILLAMAVGAGAPIFVLWFKARRRLSAIENQLPDILITIAASLKAGHSFRQGLQAVVAEDAPPASKEFKRVLTETRLGRPMDDALDEMAERVGSKNLKFVITAVTIQRQVGGSLAGIFDMVAEAVRNRQQFARKIKSLTAMGRMSAYTLVALPVFMAFALTMISREYMQPLWHTSVGHMLIAVALVMMAFGSLILKKIVSFRG